MIKELMRGAFDVNASDIHLTVGLPPMFRVNGVLRQAGEEPLRREDTYNMAMELMDDRRRTQFLDNGEADFSYEIENVCRFRVNVFKQSNCVAAALRLISNNIPSFEDLRLPDVISDLAMLPRGLVLVKGICLLCVFHGSYRTGSNLPPSDFRIPDSGKERGKNSGYDGIWYPHGRGCTSDERDY